MILWTYKLYTTIRRAIAGRRYPYQLAWAVAFGVLLGIIPHGNLLALGILIVVLSLRLNHAMAALTAIAVSFLATRLDPFSHDVGDWVLTHPQVRQSAATVWDMPLVPWTDLNNTIVMGSFLLGTVALVPIFLVTYPIFRWLAPAEEIDQEASQAGADSAESRSRQVSHSGSTTAHAPLTDNDRTRPVVLVDQAHGQTPAPKSTQPHHPSGTSPRNGDTSQRADAERSPVQTLDRQANDRIEFVELAAPPAPADHRVAVETRIDVIRMTEADEAESAEAVETSSSPTDFSHDQQPMDEALNYLLRQLRDSQQRKSA